jgi:hypothetical protein
MVKEVGTMTWRMQVFCVAIFSKDIDKRTCGSSSHKQARGARL